MTPAREVQLPGTEVHVLHSDTVGDDFEISLVLPPPHVQGPVPVVYLTDANNGGVGLGAYVLSTLTGGGEIPPVLGVGVGYPIGEDFSAFLRLRTRDFSPTEDAQQLGMIADLAGLATMSGGGAKAFLAFLTHELRPWVKGRFNVTDDATLYGDSLGGLFATYTLLHEPNAFSRYVIGSPWLCWDHPMIFRDEEAYAARHDDLSATVFLAAGGDEHVLPPGMAPVLGSGNTAADTRRLAASLESRHYPNLRLSTRIFPEQTHMTIPPILMAHGLRAVFTDERQMADPHQASEEQLST